MLLMLTFIAANHVIGLITSIKLHRLMYNKTLNINYSGRLDCSSGSAPTAVFGLVEECLIHLMKRIIMLRMLKQLPLKSLEAISIVQKYFGIKTKKYFLTTLRSGFFINSHKIIYMRNRVINLAFLLLLFFTTISCATNKLSYGRFESEGI